MNRVRLLEHFKKILISVSFFFLLTFFSKSPLAFAHGGVGIVGNQCVLTIGPFRMLFSGYQPKNSSEEICDDIPEIGKTIIVLDFVQPQLRAFLVDYRIIKDSEANRLETSKKEYRVSAEMEESTIYYLPAKIYSTGSFMFKYKFSAGKYVGIVTARSPDGTIKHHSVFPFEVGLEKWHLLYYVAAIIFFGVVLVLILLLKGGPRYSVTGS